MRVVPLKNILENHPKAIEYLAHDLRIRGYCFVKMNDEFVAQIDDVIKIMESFFAQSSD